jgi:hypothetical protein
MRVRRLKTWCVSVATKSSPLIAYLGDKSITERFSGEDWSLMFSEARQAGLLSRLGLSLSHSPEIGAQLPERLGIHVLAGSVQAEAFQLDVRRELGYVQDALSGMHVPVILLKGASYVLLDLPAASGRIFSDIDILVPRQHVASAEASLMLGGWSTGKLDAYDQRYYREWSHEIPPMTHLRRGTTIDLHHSLVMPTCRVRVDSDRMVSEAIPVDEKGFWWRLKDEDILLHAASHLMLNSEFERGLRDLWDIDLLFRHFMSRSPSFPDRVLERSEEVGLGKIVRQALFLAKRFFRAPVPDSLLPSRHSLFLRLVACASSTRHPDTRSNWLRISDALLIIREMYLRLPNYLLAVHLVHKASSLSKKTEEKTAV